jgi:phosphoglycolate phosphatase
MDAILFDWDGTLADSLASLYDANVAVMEALELPFDEAIYRRSFAPDWRLMYRRLGVPEDRLDEANDVWLGAYDGGATAVFPGVADALGRLAAAGHPIGLVTAGERSVVEVQVQRSGLLELLPVRVYGDDLPVHKPDPAPLRLALGRLGLADRPERSAYVGDVPDDMRMARAVGARAVGITSALGEAAQLRAAGAHEVAPSVLTWVDRFLGIMRTDGRPRLPSI